MMKKFNAAKPKQADYVYVLQAKARHQGSKILFTEFWWIGPYNIEKAVSNNNYLVRKVGTDKIQVLHRVRLRNSQPANSYWMHKSRHVSGSWTRKSSLGTMI